MTPKTLRVGIVGHGFMGKMHAHAYRSLPFYYDPPPARAILAGVAARREETLRAAVDAWGYEFATTDYRELCARDDIDIIDVAVPNDLHREVVLAALEHGKHVYVDKPLASNFPDAMALLRESAVRPESITRVAFQYRFVPALLRAAELVNAGALGRIFSVRAAYLHAGYVDPSRPYSWRLDPARSGKGGALFDLGVHAVDLVRHLFGEFSEVLEVAETFTKERPLAGEPSKRMPTPLDELSILLFRLESGALGTLEASRVATGAQDELRIEAHGERGALSFNLMQPNFLHVFDGSLPEAPLGGDRGFRAIECVARYPRPSSLPGPKNTVGWERFHIHSIHEFLRAVVAGKPSKPDFLDGARAQAVLEAALLSREARAWTRVPPVTLGGRR